MQSIAQLLAKKPAVVTVAPHDSVRQALEVLATHNIGAVPVLDGHRLVGIFSERDYAAIVFSFQLAYAIGVAQPLSIYADLYDTGNVDGAKLEKALGEVMSLSPRGIREHLHLNRPIYVPTSAYGHFGREPDAEGGFSWEKTDLAEQIKSSF